MVEFGRLGVIVDNVAVAGPTDPITEVFEGRNWAMSVLTGGLFCGTELAARVMNPHCGASIISLGSTAAVLAGWGPDCDAVGKRAFAGMTKTVAEELAPSTIRVNTVPTGKMVKAVGCLSHPTGSHCSGRARPVRCDGLDRGIADYPLSIANAAMYLASDAGPRLRSRTWPSTQDNRRRQQFEGERR